LTRKDLGSSPASGAPGVGTTASLVSVCILTSSRSPHGPQLAMIEIKADLGHPCACWPSKERAMKHAVIFAHPNPDSLTAAVAKTYAKTVRSLGHEVVERDLYGISFDPCLKAGEIPGPGAPQFAPEVVAERRTLADCDVFALVYPLWFNAPPAILKGYVDRVFSMGFGYEAAMLGTDPLLAGRKLISFTTSGAPVSWFRDTGGLGALMALFDAHLASVCGLSILDHVHTGGVAPGITADAVETILERVRAATRDQFAAAPAAAP
jgi:NAD(P)H dehydrogenase (quinone)